MKIRNTDIVIVGAGPVGLLCAYLAHLSGLKTVIIDKSEEPLQVGRADALNARSLQLLKLINLFDSLYPLGKQCNTSSVWANGKFISRQSSWWEALEGCEHKHFLMLGQAYLERLLDNKLKENEAAVIRKTYAIDIQITQNGCRTYLSNDEIVDSEFVIGADGAHSFVREHFQIPFQIIRPQLIWAVIDGVINSDFPKVSEIIVFQAETSDVAWIPREGNIDRFYVRMDVKEFNQEEVLAKINLAIKPHSLSFKEIVWFSQFSVKESVAEQFAVAERVFLAGDACHIHSVNGGQGLNTGIGDAFNLIWKLNMTLKFKFSNDFLKTYENERKPVALNVIETSGKLVRSTKYSLSGTHALDYVKIVEAHAGNITGMGIRYGNKGLSGSRLYDLEINSGDKKLRLYSLLDYNFFTLFLFSAQEIKLNLPKFINFIQVYPNEKTERYWTDDIYYNNYGILVRPDSYIASEIVVDSIKNVDFYGYFLPSEIMNY